MRTEQRLSSTPNPHFETPHPYEVADAFCATRLGGEGGRAYGTLPRGVDCAAIVERHRPGA